MNDVEMCPMAAAPRWTGRPADNPVAELDGRWSREPVHQAPRQVIDPLGVRPDRELFATWAETEEASSVGVFEPSEPSIRRSAGLHGEEVEG